MAGIVALKQCFSQAEGQQHDLTEHSEYAVVAADSWDHAKPKEPVGVAVTPAAITKSRIERYYEKRVRVLRKEGDAAI